jgi:hypothetical protein
MRAVGFFGAYRGGALPLRARGIAGEPLRQGRKVCRPAAETGAQPAGGEEAGSHLVSHSTAANSKVQR